MKHMDAILIIICDPVPDREKSLWNRVCPGCGLDACLGRLGDVERLLERCRFTSALSPCLALQDCELAASLLRLSFLFVHQMKGFGKGGNPGTCSQPWGL